MKVKGRAMGHRPLYGIDYLNCLNVLNGWNGFSAGEAIMTEVVIFDIDGTLVDSVDLHVKSWQAAFEKFGKQISFESIRPQIGKGSDQLLPVFFSKTELEQFGEELDKYRSELFKKEYLPKVKAFPKVRDFVATYQARQQANRACLFGKRRRGCNV